MCSGALVPSPPNPPGFGGEGQGGQGEGADTAPHPSPPSPLALSPSGGRAALNDQARFSLQSTLSLWESRPVRAGEGQQGVCEPTPATLSYGKRPGRWPLDANQQHRFPARWAGLGKSLALWAANHWHSGPQITGTLGRESLRAANAASRIRRICLPHCHALPVQSARSYTAHVEPRLGFFEARISLPRVRCATLGFELKRRRRLHLPRLFWDERNFETHASDSDVRWPSSQTIPRGPALTTGVACRLSVLPPLSWIWPQTTKRGDFC